MEGGRRGKGKKRVRKGKGRQNREGKGGTK